MRIIALLSWYDEDPTWLTECVTSIAPLCDHLIAVDGAYAAFPGAREWPLSDPAQADAIALAAVKGGMGCSLYAPTAAWDGPWGGEVAKRDFMLQAGKTVAESGDWFLRIDADEVLTDFPSWLKPVLADTDCDVAEVILWERYGPQVEKLFGPGTSQTPLRALFRNLPGLRIEQTHYTVKADGIVLSGANQAPAEQLFDVQIEHRTQQRPLSRKLLKAEYNAIIPDFERVEDVPE